MKYFYDCKTKEEAKAKYYDLCKEHHPDKGGSVDVMKEINRQYDEFEENTVKDPYGYSHTFYGHGFRTNNKYTDMQGREYASRFDRQTTGGVFDDIPLNHPVRGYCKMKDEEVWRVKAQLAEYYKTIQELRETNFKQTLMNVEYTNKYFDLEEKFKKYKKRMTKEKKGNKKCVTEPNAENVIAL